MTTTALLLAMAACSSSLGPSEIEIEEIEITPSSLSVEGGHLARFSVKAFDKDSAVIPGAPISFESSDRSVAVVDGDGTIWAFRSGDVTVTAKPGRGANGNIPPGQARKSATVSVSGVDGSRPGTVTDLAVDEVSASTVKLTFTEVDDGAGAPASYLIRFQIAPMEWGDAADVLFGSCAAPVSGTEAGAPKACTVSNLKAGTRYEFQLVAFRGALGGTIVYGDLSNRVSATTPGISTASQIPPWLDLNFEKYGSTEELRAAETDFLNGVEDLGIENIFLDTSLGYQGGGLSRSMRYDWVDQGASTRSIGRGVLLPEPVDEVWVELALRWSENFTTCHPENPPCDHKTFFLQVTPDLNYRWSVHFGGGAGEAGPETNITIAAPRGKVIGFPDAVAWQMYTIPYPRPYTGANQYFDGAWHIVRLHVKHSTDVDTYNARIQLWVDGRLTYDTDVLQSEYGAPAFSTATGTKVRAILLGRNKDKGLDSGTESMWIGRVRAWRDDPGWQ